MTDERMSDAELIEQITVVSGYYCSRCGADITEGRDHAEDCAVTLVKDRLADTQEIVRLAREVVEECEDDNDCVSGSPLMHAIHALRDRLEKHDAR